MSRDTTRDLRKMGRRNFVKKLAGFGLSGTVLREMTQEDLEGLTDHPKDEVPIAVAHRHTNHDAVERDGARPERRTAFDTIPRDEWIRYEAAHRAAADVSRRLRGFDDRTARFTNAGVFTPKDRDDVLVEVSYDVIDVGPDGEGTIGPAASRETVIDGLPDAVDREVGKGRHAQVVEDIPVRVTRQRYRLDTHTDDPDHYEARYRPVPGGAHVTDGAGGSCTTCSPAYDLDTGRTVLITAGHCLDEGEQMYQPATHWWYDNVVGACQDSMYDRDYPSRFDAATVATSDADTTYRLADDGGGYRADIQGTVPWDFLKYRYVDVLDQQGASIGTATRMIRKTYPHDVSWDTDYRTVELYGDSYGGDSGGPYFESDDDGGALIAADHYSSNDDPAWSRGTYIGDVENQFNLIV